MALPAMADGMIMPIAPPDPPQPIQYLAVKYHHVTIDVKDQVLHCEIDQVFHNPNPYDIEGEYLFPVPAGASVSQLSMEVDGEPTDGKMLPRDEARGIYEDIVRSLRDPALLEYVGRDTYRARIFPIPANGDKRVTISYDQVVPVDNGLAEVLYPLNTEKFSSKPLEEVSVAVTIESRTPIASVYSPTHEIDVHRVTDRKVVAGYEDSGVKPDEDFLLYYSMSPEDLGVNVISTWPEGEEEGYFLLLAAPAYEADPDKRVPKDVVFILDTSGSMAGDGKIDQAREALKYCVSSLNDEDRVNIVKFSTAQEALADHAVPVEGNRQRALDFVDGLEAAGGTNMEAALEAGLGSVETSGRPRIVVLLSDGNPTVGETSLDTLLERAEEWNHADARLFVFGVGYDVNIHFLDKLAEQGSGLPQYVRPTESIEVPVSSFFAKMSHPALADIDIQVAGVDVKDVYPQATPDLFHGSQLLLAGRYDGMGSATVVVEGSTGDGRYVDEFPVSFTDKDANPRVARLWAARKIGYLVDQMRLNGSDPELVEEVVALSIKFGIMTEYTAFLVREENVAVARPGVTTWGPGAMGGAMSPGADEAVDAFARDLETAAEAEEGGWAMSQSANAQVMKGQTNAQTLNAYVDAEGQTQRVEGVKYVAGRAFYYRNGRWVDAHYTDDLDTVQVQNFSSAQFQLGDAAPILNQFMAVGEHVIITLDGRAVEIGPEGVAELTAQEVDELLGEMKGQAMHAPDDAGPGESTVASVGGLSGADWTGLLLGLGIVGIGIAAGVRRVRA
jgi:Ca-activated chloride channel family protein